ncbi:MAG TPA: hypothetical protein VMH81_23425 [Bryobacteraceae bacterium]|nr:hypothetical protein [Bryobacteraceae bacterium]
MMRLFPALLILSGMTSQAAVTGRQADLDFVANQVPKLHANFFFQLDPARYQQAVAQIAANINTLTDAEFYDQLTALIAMAGDPHTAIYLNGTAAAAAGFQQFPLLFRWLDDGVFVTAASPDYSRALGAQLIQVGDAPIDQVAAQLATLIPHTNDQWVRANAQAYLRGQQILQGLHLAPAGTATPLTFRTLAGDVFTLNVIPGALSAPSYLPDPNAGTYPLYLRNTSQNYWFLYEPQDRLLYFKYNACTDVTGNPFSTFAANLLATLDSNPVDTLVFDFRGNGGGNSAVWNPLIDGVSQRIPALLSNPRFRTYGVIDKGTFSSGSLDAMIMKQPVPPEIQALYPQVDFATVLQMIGEPTGGATGGYGNVIPFTLPSSGLVGQYSTQYINTPSYITPAPWFAPDIAISVRSTDFFARHDPVMAAILARTENPPAAPSGSAIVVNGASFRSDHGLAPGSFASAFGTFSQTPDQILVGGLPGQIASATASQVNFIVPASAPLGTAAVSVRGQGKELATGQVTLTAAGPGIFVLAPDPAQPGAVENQDFSVNSGANSAASGSIVSVYATGNGPVDGTGNAPVSVFFGDVPAEVVASIPLSQYPGLWQINTRVPAGLAGQWPLFVIAQSLASNAVTVAIH